MKIEEIQGLIKFVAKSGVNEVELEMDNIKLVIKTGAKEVAPQIIHAAAPMAAAPIVAPAPVATVAAPAPIVENSNYIEIKSPMIGTFYRSATPEKPVFKNVGDDVKPGDVLCIIEAMKLFNEIEAEVSGKIVKVLVDDASPVEYDQPLFLIDPS
ncbi:MAG: acetyl-CoA carboxylase biotin carboxyl carrier protein [Salibacteraceae bacterium]|nr:acetyl-CoA carboxylase biotin carboxyl carrier protein [Salibacteraceae bacterium]|tara:strand:+ start:30220 stop:30684 length:465 start_codon:yes stop_codon:yes gene_type:complete